MSLFSIANPGGGGLKSFGDEKSVDNLFNGKIVSDPVSDGEDRTAVGGFIKGKSSIRSVKVAIFDLSKDDERSDYEKLWAELLEKMANGLVIVDSHCDLVKHQDGTSYWMKYIEYVEFVPNTNTKEAGGVCHGKQD